MEMPTLHISLVKNALFLHVLAALVWPSISNASSTNSTHPKRGLIYIQTSTPNDDKIFTIPTSPLTWYYNYSPWPTSSLTSWTTNFVPMIHGASDTATDVSTIQSLVNNTSTSTSTSNTITHVLTFNEPDGSTSSGGSAISPSSAAQVYIDNILPLRSPPYNLHLSLPATTGSPRGLQWLHDFNSSCHRLRPATHEGEGGCPFDFIATHWYGADLASLTSWLSQIHALYPDKDIWVTEFAIPGVDGDASLAFLNTSLPVLDTLAYVTRYAWFGTFRAGGAANEWTGGGVSMLDKQGRLTGLGAAYLGGEQDGFHEGQASQSASASASAPSRRRRSVGLVLAVWMLVGMYLIW